MEVLRDHAPALALGRVGRGSEPTQEERVLQRLVVCRTLGLGGQVVRCPGCGDSALLPHACRDRHCPTCPSVRQWRWLEQRKRRALDVPHFHSVFTVAPELRPLIQENPRRLYAALMAAAATTVRWACRRSIGEARVAFTSVLHTWSRSLEYHPHVHVLLAAGGLAPDGSRWVVPERRALLPADDEVRARFRDTLLRRIRRARARGRLRLPPGWGEERLALALARAASRRWYVYSKRTVRSDEAYEYLARYTCRVGLTAARLLAYDGRTVKLATRGGALELPGQELVRRFLLHVLPRGFTRIRYHGLFVSRHAANHALARRRIAEQGLGCGFAAALEGRDEGEAGAVTDSWQEVCARNGHAVERCHLCDGVLEYTSFPPSPQLTARYRAALLARALARGPP